MLIAIGTKNKTKIQALQEALEEVQCFDDFEMLSFAVPSGIAEQPLSLEETILGAKNRAQASFLSPSLTPKYGFGIESGLVEAPRTRTGFLNICVCSAYNGKEYSTGFSTGFEVPLPILRRVLEDKLDLSQACIASGISSNEKMGEEEGLIGILTKGKVNRLEYTKECIHAALLQIVNYEWYNEVRIS
jgi:inosine/xanthosine triphosphatase